jgi:hypothetical protein
MSVPVQDLMLRAEMARPALMQALVVQLTKEMMMGLVDMMERLLIAMLLLWLLRLLLLVVMVLLPVLLQRVLPRCSIQ